MIENIVIVFGVLMLIIVAFFVGVWTGISSALDMSENESEDLYCFDCEIEMPVKVKNGRMYCSNCGLLH